MKRTLLAVALAPLCFQSNAFAAEATPDEVMVVTANRFEQAITNVIAPVSVVTKEEIDAIQAKSLTDVLRRLPGIQISGNGGYGQTQSVFVRGTNASHVLVLINGVRIGSATSGSSDFGSIPLTGIERIEFIRGSRAAVYGADAVGGVINIITTYQEGEQLAEVAAGAGSDHYWLGKAAAAGQITDDLWGKVAVNAENSDGFSASSSAGQEDDDGYKNRDMVMELGGYLTPEWRLRANAYYHDGQVEFDNPAASKKDIVISNFSVGAEFLGDNLYSNLTLATNRDKSKSFNTGNDGIYQTDRNVINWQNLYKLTNALSLGGGIDWYQDDISKTTSQFDQTKQDNTAYYLTSIYSSDDIQAEANLRSDDNEYYGRNNTWQLGLGWRLSSEYRVTVSAGTAFKAPSFNDLHFPSTCFPEFGCFGGNPDLKPEESQNVEVALESRLSFADIRLAVYEQKVDNLIVWGNTPENVSKAEIKGLELIAGFTVGAFYNDFSYDYIEPEDTQSGKQLIRRSKHNAKWNISYLAESWQLDVSALYQGKSYDDKANTVELDAYSLVDVAASYFVTENLTIRGRVANVFDKDYVTAKDFNTQERSYFATVTYQF